MFQTDIDDAVFLLRWKFTAHERLPLPLNIEMMRMAMVIPPIMSDNEW